MHLRNKAGLHPHFSRGHIFDFDRIIRAVVARSLHYDANLMTVDDREEIWELMSEVHTAAHRHDSIGEKYIMQELERGAQLARAPLMTSVPLPSSAACCSFSCLFLPFLLLVTGWEPRQTNRGIVTTTLSPRAPQGKLNGRTAQS